MDSTRINNTPPDQWLTTGQAAQRIGCHRDTVVNLCNAGAFPNAIRLATQRRIPAGDVEAYIQRNRIKPADDR